MTIMITVLFIALLIAEPEFTLGLTILVGLFNLIF